MKDFLWVEKHAPNKVQDCILPAHVKNIMVDIVAKQDLQNMIFYSSPGTGKTTCAVALCKQIKADHMIINGSNEGRFLETAREKVSGFASSTSMFNSDRPKVVIYDEFDNTLIDVQKLLRGSINLFQDNCRFIFTVNSIGKIIDPLKSRTTMVDFSIPKSEKLEIGKQFFERCEEILKMEDVDYDKKALAQYVMKMIPDFRKILNELQSYGGSKKIIDVGILNMAESSFDGLYDAIKNKSFKDARAWLVDHNAGGEFYGEFSRYLIKNAPSKAVPFLILIMAKYQHMGVTAFDLELNASACILEVINAINRGGDS